MTSKIEVSRELAEFLEKHVSGTCTRHALPRLEELRALLAAPEAPRQSEPVAWGAWRKSLNRFHYIECNVDYMQRTYGKASEDMGIDFELVPLYRHPAPLSPDHSGGGAGMVLPEREPLPITDGMDRLMEAYRLGEFRLEGGSPTVEAMSCKSFDEHEIALQAYDFESYSAGYQAAMYEEVKSLLGHIACLDKVKELNQ